MEHEPTETIPNVRSKKPKEIHGNILINIYTQDVQRAKKNSTPKLPKKQKTEKQKKPRSKIVDKVEIFFQTQVKESRTEISENLSSKIRYIEEKLIHALLSKMLKDIGFSEQESEYFKEPKKKRISEMDQLRSLFLVAFGELFPNIPTHIQGKYFHSTKILVRNSRYMVSKMKQQKFPHKIHYENFESIIKKMRLIIATEFRNFLS